MTKFHELFLKNAESTKLYTTCYLSTLTIPLWKQTNKQKVKYQCEKWSSHARLSLQPKLIGNLQTIQSQCEADIISVRTVATIIQYIKQQNLSLTKILFLGMCKILYTQNFMHIIEDGTYHVH